MQAREKVEKSRFAVFFQSFVAPEGRKVGSLKRRVQSHLARSEMKNCTPLWRKAHLEVKMCKTHTMFGPLLEVQMSKNKRTLVWREALLEGAMSKNCTPLWREAHLEVKMRKTQTMFGPLLEVQMSKNKRTPVWREAHFQVKMYKAHGVRSIFWKFTCRKSARPFGAKHISKSKVLKTDGVGPLLDVQMSFRVAGARDSVHCQK